MASSSWILVVCALEEEARFVKEGLFEEKAAETLKLTHPNISITSGLLSGTKVHVVTCGMGQVDATIATVTLLNREEKPPMCVLSVGCSGGHKKGVLPGDVILATSIVPLDCKMVRANGEKQHIGHRFTTEKEPLMELPTNTNLLELAKEVASNPMLTVLPSWPTTPDRKPVVHLGKVGSTEAWTQDEAEIRRFHSELGTYCEEMEAYGVSRVCLSFGDIPFFAIKDIANNELEPQREGSEDESGMGESMILDKIGKNAAIVAISLITKLVSTID